MQRYPKLVYSLIVCFLFVFMNASISGSLGKNIQYPGDAETILNQVQDSMTTTFMCLCKKYFFVSDCTASPFISKSLQQLNNRTITFKIRTDKLFPRLLHLRMLRIEYPQHPFKIKEDVNKHIIFDEVRKKWIILTPEEWVRQNFIQYLLQVKKYPASVIAVEKEIKLGELKKRCDIVVYKSHQPWMIVECKEQTLSLNDAVIQQILRYNISLKVKILVVTNGENAYAVQLNEDGITPLDVLPEWNDEE